MARNFCSALRLKSSTSVNGRVFHASPAEPDQRIAARKIFERTDDEGSVVGRRHDDILAGEFATIDPELIGKKVGIGDDDDVDLAGRDVVGLGCLVRRGRAWRRRRKLVLSCRPSSFASLSAAFLSSAGAGFGAPSGNADLASPESLAARTSLWPPAT